MALAIGTRLGRYEIQSALGAGGMGEVYKARDTRLDRTVAVKILPAALASDPQFRERFDREARAISKFTHANICTLYDVGEQDGTAFLVMELLAGETLADRLKKGAFPLPEALRLAMQIADALGSAHRHGIVHRDLKPGNVMLTKSGAKLLDFGLAKEGNALGDVGGSMASTAAPSLTTQGTLLGTLLYMAPEQLEGREADARSDIFAFGAVLYEMATGRRAFEAGSGVAVASAILREDPPPMSSANAVVPFALERIVRTCLAKDPDERWQSARDVLLQIRAVADQREPAASAHVSRVDGRNARMTRWAPWGIAAVAVALSALLALMRPASVASPPAAIRFLQPPPVNGAFYIEYENTGLSVSPNGSQIAFSAHDASGVNRVWLRPIGTTEAAALDGTDGATSMFWSPDGRSLAFFTGSKLRRVDLPGGTPVSICDVREGIGFSGTWGADGQILFSSIEGEAIFSVSASGGAPKVMLKPDASRGETRLNWPVFLPDGRRLLYLQRRRDGSGHLILAEEGKPARDVMLVQSSVQYTQPGYLLFAREGTLVGQHFDESRGEIVGAPFSIADSVGYFFTTSVARFAVSPNGVLVYQPLDEEQRLGWFDRAGRETGTLGGPGRYQRLRISPDDRRVAFDRMRGGAFDVWEADLERGGETRLTFGVSSEGTGPWLPDGGTLFFNADRGAPPEVFRKNLTTGAEEPVVPASGTFQQPQDVSPDGRTLLYTQRSAGGDHIWIFALDRSRAPAVAFDASFNQEDARFARDGRYFSFDSTLSGRSEVYVSPFPPTGERVQVSTNGGSLARWSRDGRELFYLASDRRLMSVPVQTNPSFHIRAPVPLFELSPSHPWYTFDTGSNGRFLAVVSEKRASEQPLTVVLNWATEAGSKER